MKFFSFIFILNVSLRLSNTLEIDDTNLDALDDNLIRIVDQINYEIQEENNDIINEITNRLVMVLEFLENNYDSVNIDGLFGIRIAEGMIMNIEKHSTKSLIKKYKINNIMLRLKILASKIFDSVIESTPDYAQNFKILIGQPFKSIDFNTRKNNIYDRLDFDILKSISSNSSLITSFNEQFSDQCYSILLDKFNDPVNNCKTNDECLEYYTKPEASGK